jgi:hypothetical protein
VRRPVSDRTLRRWVREFRKLFPTDLPVRVSRRRFPRDPKTRRPEFAGWCTRWDHIIEIQIEETLDRCATIDTLMHEWAHARREEDETREVFEHDDAFWIELGSMYRAYWGTR